jgi:hypothetical protein
LHFLWVLYTTYGLTITSYGYQSNTNHILCSIGSWLNQGSCKLASTIASKVNIFLIRNYTVCIEYSSNSSRHLKLCCIIHPKSLLVVGTHGTKFLPRPAFGFPEQHEYLCVRARNIFMQFRILRSSYVETSATSSSISFWILFFFPREEKIQRMSLGSFNEGLYIPYIKQ